MKTKRNKNAKKGSKGNKGSKARATKYPVEYLGIALLALVLIETALLGNVSSTDVTSALGLFDSSTQIAEAGQTLAAAVEPMIVMASDINKFYAVAAVETTQLLDASEQIKETTLAAEKFIGLAPNYSSRVAGVSIESCN